MFSARQSSPCGGGTGSKTRFPLAAGKWARTPTHRRRPPKAPPPRGAEPQSPSRRLGRSGRRERYSGRPRLLSPSTHIRGNSDGLPAFDHVSPSIGDGLWEPWSLACAVTEESRRLSPTASVLALRRLRLTLSGFRQAYEWTDCPRAAGVGRAITRGPPPDRAVRGPHIHWSTVNWSRPEARVQI